MSFWKKGLGSLCGRPDCCRMVTASGSVPKPSPQLAPSGPCPMPSIAYSASAPTVAHIQTEHWPHDAQSLPIGLI